MSSKGTRRRAASLPVLLFQRRARRLKKQPSCRTDSVCNCESCAQSDLLSVYLSLCPSRGLHIYTSCVHESQHQRRSESVYLFWRRLRTRVAIRRCARAALAVVCFERRGLRRRGNRRVKTSAARCWRMNNLRAIFTRTR